ncbi:MAG: radical SAM protein [Candidatus Omnitrophica bacterium]|nr:radical SAM protein [Candidatus Omnitrophota bacterium]
MQKLLERARARIEDYHRLQDLGLICRHGDFFPSVHYPPITMYPRISEEDLFRTYSPPEDGLFDVYAHIPFCIQHCIFCHYPVKTGGCTEEKDKYLDAIEKEMDLYMARLGIDKIKVRSILVGGGTPTYLSPKQLERFLRSFTSRMDTSQMSQFSYDVDPNNLLGEEGAERMRIMKDHGVDRLTIGLQSMDDDILKLMNRAHTSEEGIRSVEVSRKAGFKLNIEFIYGYQGQTFENWASMMKEAIALDTDEIQLYRLKIIPYGDYKGPIGNCYIRNPEDFPEPDEAIMMKQIAIDLLESNGYHQNLTRVFTKKREDYSHYADNQCCKLYDEIGFGLTAFSSMRDRFGLNTQDFGEYYGLVSEGKLPVNRGLVRNAEDQLRWCIILPLKNREVWKTFYNKQTGKQLDAVFREKRNALKEHGLISEDDKMMKLTELGRFFADEVCQQFHAPEYMPFPEESYSDGPLNPFRNNSPL